MAARRRAVTVGGAGLLLRGARDVEGKLVDVRVRGPVVAETAPGGTLGSSGAEEILDLAGHVLGPSAAEPHAHLDKAFTADAVPNPSGDLLGAVAAWRAYRRTLAPEDITRRARAAALEALARGVTAIRTHVDVGEGIELRGIDALLALREELRHLVDLQVVAMAYPVTGEGGAENRRQLRAALDRGADLLGGAAHLDPDPRGAIETTLGLAEEYGVPVDLHVDEHLGEQLDLAALASLAGQGFRHPVTASHCVSLGMRPLEIQADVATAVAAAGVSVVTLPHTNLYLQGRNRPTATPRGLTAVDALLSAGVTVAAGGDNVQDPFHPLGCGDPLQVAQLLVLAAHLDCGAAHSAVTDGPRAAMGLAPVALRAGSPADLLAVGAPTLREAIASATERRIVIKAGRVVARTDVHRAPLVGAGTAP